MSQALRIAVATLMKSDSGLKSLLAPHPLDATLPAVFAGSKSQAPPVYDCLTYRMSDAAPDPRFDPPIPVAPGAGGGGSDVEDYYLDAEAWTDQADSAPIEAIGARLKALFNGTAFDAPPDGRVFRAQCVTEQTDLYDKTLNAWYGLYRFRLRLQRPFSV